MSGRPSEPWTTRDALVALGLIALLLVAYALVIVVHRFRLF